MYFIVYKDNHEIVGLTESPGSYESTRPVVFVAAAGLLPQEAKIVYDGASYWPIALAPPVPRKNIFRRMLGARA